VQDAARRLLEQAEAEAAGRERRVDQHLDDPALEELDQPLGRLEEVEGVLRGRRVDDDQIVLVALPHLVDLLHRRVLDAARQRLRSVLVERVLQDPLARLAALGESVNEIVEGALHVEHHRRQLSRLAHAESPQRVALERLGLVAERLDAERVGQAPGRIDGEHQGAPSTARGLEGEGRRHRGLADAATSHADGDAAAHEKRVGELRRPHAGASPKPSSASARTPSASGPSTPWAR
jgi:hypothetical protein